MPVLEKEFLLDQRSVRKMFIGSVDKIITSKLANRADRDSKRLKYYANQSQGECHDKETNRESWSEMEVSENEDHSACISSSGSNSSDHCSKRNMMKFPTVARECDRYGVSNAAGAAIATAALTDYGIINQNDSTSVIHRAKLKRQRQQLRTTLSEEAKSSFAVSGPVSLFFDGRKDHTICMTSVNSKGSITEEHITLIEEPQSVFLGHVTPLSGSSASIKTAIVDYFKDNDISMN